MTNHKRALVAAIILAWMPLVISAAYPAVWQWSETASSNSSIDPQINWREGQSPSSVNDSARAMMAALAGYRDDISGSLATTGTASAYLVTTNQGLPNPPTDGQLISVTVNITNGVAATLTADGGGAYPIQSAPGVGVGAATLIAGSPYTLKFSLTNNAWMLRDLYGNAFGVPLGAFLHSTISTPPNANFVLPVGQCLSTTTYATYWVALGSPASGSCSGGQFAIVNVAGRNLTALDNLSGSAANVLTSSSTGCGTAFTTLGATCANGKESNTLITLNLPPYTPSGSVTTTINNAGYLGVFAAGSVSNAMTSGVGNYTNTSSIFAGNAQGGTSQPVPSVTPNIGVYVFLRVL